MPQLGRASGRRTAPRPALALLVSTVLAASGLAQAAAPPPVADEPAGDAPAAAAARPDDASDRTSRQPVVLHDTVAVTATRSSLALREAPGHVDVIGAEEIERRLVGDAADLVRYQPGVYAASDPTRLGVGGFNIRGIGGNRVLTRIDGVPTADGFDFDRLAIPRFTIDPEILERVEIVRSAVSTLYGSDALGGVVSLQTRDPRDFLLLGDGGATYLGAKVGWDGRDDEQSGSLTLARGSARWQGSLWTSLRDGHETDNQGEVASLDSLRTAPNPIDRQSTSALGKLTYAAGPNAFWKLSAELFDAEAGVEAYSLRGAENLGPTFGPGVTYRIDTLDFDADDSHRRWRLSLERIAQTDRMLYDQLAWRLYGQSDETEQTTFEKRETTTGGSFFGPLRTTPLTRDALFRFEQETLGGEVELQKSWTGGRIDQRLTYGLAASRDRFDMLRDRADLDPATGAELPSSTPFPTKYFPRSTADEVGLFVQDELSLLEGRLLLVPGLRYDRFSLDPDEDDAVYLSGNPGTPAPVELQEEAVSPRLGVVVSVREPLVAFVQYARGFRAPSYSEVNNGFSNFRFGYRTLPNPDLQPETSDNLEAGLRWTSRRLSVSLVGFDNRYDDFIETAVAAVDPDTGFIDFQPRNVAQATIRGIELAAEARIARSWQLRAAYASIRGDDEERDRPLDSIAPPQLALGLGYQAASGRWGAELATTLVDAKDADRIDRTTFDQYATPAYELVDLTGHVELPGGWSIQGGIFNLLDETYWTWPNALGLLTGSPALDRYTSPGRSLSMALRYRR